MKLKKYTIISAISILLLLISGLALLIVGFLECMPEKTVNEKLMITINNDAVQNVYEWKNEVSSNLWVQIDCIDDAILKNINYKGIITKVDDDGMYILNNNELKFLRSAVPRPEWFKYRNGYSVYEISKVKSDIAKRKHIICICTIFIPPNKKNIYIYQWKTSRL